MSVSCVTVTCPQRREFVSLLAECIRSQTVRDKILEWVIVFIADETTPTLTNVDELIQTSGVENVRVIEMPPGTKLGAARERSNRESRGKTIVVMDDDDIYPPMYIQYALQVMKTKKREFVAGDKPYMYDYDTDSWFQWKYSPRTCTNNTFIYTRDFALANHYNLEDTHAEEKAFVGRELAFPLLADYGVIQLSHGKNTVNKRQMIMSPNSMVIRQLNEPPAQLLNTLPDGLWDKYMSVILRTVSFTTEPEGGDQEVVFYCGQQQQGPWSPESQELGGSEQAVVQLSNEFSQRGYKVFVYNHLPDGIDEVVTETGVTYRHYRTFKIRDRRYPRLIVWRRCGYNPLLTQYGRLLNVGKLIVDLHDCTQPPSEVLNIPGVQVMVKSEYHKQMMSKKQSSATFHVIQNGVRLDLFAAPESPVVTRQPYRFVYTSDYSRGIIPFIQHVWPHIVQARPEAELHTYYGGSPALPTGVLNVCDHGRRSAQVVAYEKTRLASFHIYLCTTLDTEIDCIAVKESFEAGCVPIMFNAGVFKERNGFRIPHQDITAETGPEMARLILQIAEKRWLTEFEDVRYDNVYPTFSWRDVADEWEQRVLRL